MLKIFRYSPLIVRYILRKSRLNSCSFSSTINFIFGRHFDNPRKVTIETLHLVTRTLFFSPYRPGQGPGFEKKMTDWETRTQTPVVDFTREYQKGLLDLFTDTVTILN